MMENSSEALLTTNNGCESEVRWSRKDAGNVPGSAVQCVKYILAQASYYSRRAWDPNETRPISKQMWSKAVALRELFRTTKILEVRQGRRRFYCCRARTTDAAIDDEGDRQSIAEAEATQVHKTYEALAQGEHVTYEQLQHYKGYHIFFRRAESRYCSCFSFLPSTQPLLFPGKL